MHIQPVPHSEAALDTLLSATIDVFGLTVHGASREETRQVVKLIADSARLVQTADLGDRAEPAPVYGS